MYKYNFYYDESEHQRRITRATFETFKHEEYHGNFIATISGWQAVDEENIKTLYLEFENKYKERKKKGELKSDSIKLGNGGFATLSRHNIPFIRDLLYMLDNEKIHFHFSVINKIEYLLNQMLFYQTDDIYSVQAMKYSIVKAIVIYRPSDVIDSIFNDPSKVVFYLKEFFYNQIEKDKENYKLKHREIESYCEILVFLNDLKPVTNYNWDYDIVFEGFLPILNAQKITDYSLGIDKEASTLEAARNMGIQYPYELDSKSHFGIRISDMISGLIGKFIRTLHNAVIDDNSIENIKKKVIDVSWFNLNDNQLELYKVLHHITIKDDGSWSGFYSGVYADDVILFKTFLKFVTQFKNSDEIRNVLQQLPEQFNSELIYNLRIHYFQQFV